MVICLDVWMHLTCCCSLHLDAFETYPTSTQVTKSSPHTTQEQHSSLTASNIQRIKPIIPHLLLGQPSQHNPPPYPRTSKAHCHMTSSALSCTPPSPKNSHREIRVIDSKPCSIAEKTPSIGAARLGLDHHGISWKKR
ncbi:hypothetical protein CC86DRAFT_57714 [Ophiobolus disseminans]|uniref:Uncharacterized protein n=1 Tax=Ophiobolus disseminans TaxID=1469910 RepID=A0A6A6ZR99_9PLEO|nr:hypothetical protein CC86DRAFT_57714 [Ophiobolus disseminans]